MEPLLNEIEIRVLGCLMEKAMATPEYYPLSLNALVNACNQKSSRQPVVAYGEETVLAALAGLKEKQLVWQSNASRVAKFEEHFSKGRNLINREAALLAVLMLRGPQTPGELRSRTERLYAFASLEEVQEGMESLSEQGLVAKLPRQPGCKEARYAQLLGDSAPDTAESPEAPPVAATGGGAATAPGTAKRLAELEDEVAALRDELTALREEFHAFRDQF